ncbi:MAG: hypothetical protein KAI53_05920, partial [Candidatus Aenigmarchaeota archaeon]|nr:hypothetical protein [Candidatus Aenigmarchaeota archaeon]
KNFLFTSEHPIFFMLPLSKEEESDLLKTRYDSGREFLTQYARIQNNQRSLIENIDYAKKVVPELVNKFKKPKYELMADVMYGVCLQDMYTSLHHNVTEFIGDPDDTSKQYSVTQQINLLEEIGNLPKNILRNITKTSKKLPDS